MSRSTFSGNASDFSGGGVYSDFSGNLTLINSTFTGNRAEFYGGAVFNGSPLAVNNATVAGNSANRLGSGIYNDFFGLLTLNNSIVTTNTAPESPNLFGDWSGAGNLTSGDPKLSPLGNWGGPTMTMPPLPDSPAIDAGVATTLSGDQRGLARVLAKAPDVGAVEVAIGDYNPGGLTLYTRVQANDSAGYFEISADPDFLPTVSTFAGTGAAGLLDAARFSAKFGYSSAVARDSSGNIIIADSGNHRIRMLSPDGTVSTIAGSGGFSGLASGPGSIAEFSFPSAVAVGPDQNVYVADTYNHRIRSITPAGDVGTYCGLGTPGFTDGVPAAARFNTPSGLAIDGDGTLYVADRGNHRIRKIGPDGTVGTLSGQISAGSANGTANVAEFTSPVGIAVDSAGNAYVTEAASHAIRKVAPDGFTNIFAGSPTISGSTDEAGGAARFSNPAGLAMRADGALLVADQGWNGVWLEIEPVNAGGQTLPPQAVFSNPAIRLAATPKPLAGIAEFFSSDPAAINTFNRDEWQLWKRSDPSGGNNLPLLVGNRPYLIQVADGTPTFTFQITGKARFFRPAWIPDRYNLVGFGLQGTPTFDQFFGPSGTKHSVSKIFTLNAATGNWQKVTGSAPMASNRAYWVFCTGPSDYVGPVAVDFDNATTGKLWFGGPFDAVDVDSGVDRLKLDLEELVFTNLGTASVSPELDLITASGSGLGLQVVTPSADSLAYNRGNQVDSALGAGSSASLGETIAASTTATLTLGAVRSWNDDVPRTKLYRLKTSPTGACFGHRPSQDSVFRRRQGAQRQARWPASRCHRPRHAAQARPGESTGPHQ